MDEVIPSSPIWLWHLVRMDAVSRPPVQKLPVCFQKRDVCSLTATICDERSSSRAMAPDIERHDLHSGGRLTLDHCGGGRKTVYK
jgi:hypothetical protein